MKAVEYVEKALSNVYFIAKLADVFSMTEDKVRSLAYDYACAVDALGSKYNYEPIDVSEIQSFSELEDTDVKNEFVKAIDDCIFVPRKTNRYKGIFRFHNRCDGRRIKNMSPFIKIFPYIMSSRNDAQVMSKIEVDVASLEEYIKEKKREGMSISYLHVMVAIFVRVIANRPQINRFIMGNRYYARNMIYITMAVRKSLRETGEETTIKFAFTGNENIYEIYEIIREEIEKNTTVQSHNIVDSIVDWTMKLPNIILSPLAGTVKLLDRVNLLPKALIDASPFHSSMFVTYLKSINLDYVYHHIYNFGSTGVFFSIGKEKYIPVAVDGEVAVRKICTLGVTVDERICDGLYFSNTFRQIRKLIEDPHALDKHLKAIIEDVD